MRSLFICLSVMLLFTSCGKRTLKDKSSDTIIIGTNAMYYPYESINQEGDLEGFDIDIANEIAKKLGKKAVFLNVSFDALMLSLKKNQIDMVISGMSITPSRQKEIAMIPYQGDVVKSLKLAFWKKIPEDITSIESFKDKKGHTVCVQVGTFQENFLLDIDGINTRSLEYTSEMIMDVKYGKSTAALLEPRIVVAMQKKFPELALLDVPMDEEHWVLGNGIGIKKENEELAKQVEKAVKELKDEHVIDLLEMKWDLQ